MAPSTNSTTSTTSSSIRPATAWGWRDTAFLVVLVVCPLVAAWWFQPEARSLAATADAQDLVVYPLVVVSGLFLYVCWRMGRNPTIAWLSAGTTLVGLQGLGLAAIRELQADAVAPHRGWLAAADVLMTLLLLSMAWFARRRPMGVDPVVAGTVAALLLTLLRMVLIDMPQPEVLQDAVLVSRWLVLAGYLVLAWVVLRLPYAPRWLLIRVVLAVACLAARRVLTFPAPDESAASAVALVLGLVGAVLLCGTALAQLRVQLVRHHAVVDTLSHRVEHLEAGVRHDRARMHEIGATIAGIASASHLLQHERLPPQRRGPLQRMLDSELSRLQRLMDQRRPSRMEEVVLDDVIEPLVLAHQARGRDVTWTPSGLTCCGRPDDIAEAVNILLENAAQHGSGRIRVAVRRCPTAVDIVVSDDGPGIPPALRPQLFNWGVRGQGSSGQGIGLHIAHRLVTEQAGALRVADDPGPGATLVITLPPPQPIEKEA